MRVIDYKTIKKIKKAIMQYNTIIIHGHVRPDGDCYGSQFGLKDMIKTVFPHKTVYVVGQECQYASFLGTMDVISDDVFQGALSIIVDTGGDDKDSCRVSDTRFKLSAFVIKIDHHEQSLPFANINWIDEESPACSQMVTNLFIYGKFNITKNGAYALYTGIYTDTGGFKYRGVDGETMLSAGVLLENGVDVETFHQLINTRTLKTLDYYGYIYSNFKVVEPGIIYLIMKREDIDRLELTNEEAANAVSNIGDIIGYPVWFLAIEYVKPDGTIEIRLRLRSILDGINKLAERYHGGGHSKAAGATLDSWDDFSKLLDELSNWVKENKTTN